MSLAALALAFCTAAQVEAYAPQTPTCGKFYIKAGSGASFAQRADVTASPVLWDPAPEGYQGNWGSAPILAAGIGYQSQGLFSADVTVSYRPQFRYRKYQTGITGTSTPNPLGNKTRQMDLDVSTVMFSLYANGADFDMLTWNPGFVSGSIYPIVGAGVGMSRLNIYNFRSTGLSPTNPPVNPFPGFSSDNEYTVRNHFTYQVMVGFEYQQSEMWAISTGYRWFDAGRFKGPSFFRNKIGDSFETSGNEWRMRFAAQEVFVELKLFL
jgi:opacity protein-like surface antigen